MIVDGSSSEHVSAFKKYSKVDPIGSKLGMYAEKYMYSDPNSSMIKQGMLLEHIIKQYLYAKGLYDCVPAKNGKRYVDLDDMLSFLEDELNEINPRMYSFCNDIRQNRNRAVHEFYDDDNAPVHSLLILESLYRHILDYFEKNRNYTNFVFGSGYVYFHMPLDSLFMKEPEAYYGPSDNPAVDAFELAFKGAFAEGKKTAKDYEWIHTLVDWAYSKGLANGELVEKVKQREEGIEFSFKEHLRGMIYSLLSNQTNWGRNIAPNLPLIDNIFHDYDVEFLKSEDGGYFESALRRIKCGNRQIARQMRDLKYNISVLERIVDEYGSLDAFVNEQGLSKAIKELASGRYKLKNMGKALVSEYLRNVGFNAVKPDKHMKRFFGNDRMGKGTHVPATEKEVFDSCNDIERKTGLSLVLIDEAIWNFCRDSKFQVCGKNPRCTHCPINEYCNRE